MTDHDALRTEVLDAVRSFPAPSPADGVCVTSQEVTHTDLEDGSLFIDWPDFWSTDRTAADWLLEDVLARGRGHSIYAPHKVGKSLLLLWCSMQLVKAGVVVIYLDYEMGEDDLHERLVDMGCDGETDLALLRYALLPSLPPLDKPEGGAAVLGLVDLERAAHPDRHIAVVIDTIGRATLGEENSNDTIRDFYRHTGLGLKQRGCTWVRLDHAGWDASRGARGASAKGDDVDVIWRLAATDGGLELHRVAARMGWVPAKVALGMTTEPVLGFAPVSDSWPLGTFETAAALDRLGFPLGGAVRDAVTALKGTGEGRRNAVVSAALKYRRRVADNPGNTRVTLSAEGPGNATEATHPNPFIHNEGNARVTLGNAPAGQAGNGGVPLREPPEPSPIPDGQDGGAS